jgi:flagellar biosynthesis/type III secretory pathway M-ring protein FliF/YscJ
MMRFQARLQKYEDAIQIITGLMAAVLVGWRHAQQGQTFWQWFPLAFFAFFGVQVLWIMVWFVRRKLTYQQLAAINKADLQAGGDGWPRHRGNGVDR